MHYTSSRRRLLTLTGFLVMACSVVWFMADRLSPPLPLAADAPFTLTGHAWANTGNAGEGVGWISFSCTDGGASGENICGSVSYGTQINADMNIYGYAWSENVGWVRFDNAIYSDCPISNCDPRVISDGGTGYEFTGMARACAVFQAGCAGTLKASDARGGWDGWISLNCENTGTCGTSDYAIRIDNNGNVLAGASPAGSFAWGDTVMGWIDFGQVVINNTCSTAPSYSCNGNISQMDSQTLWCVDNPRVDTDCTLTGQVCNAATGQCEVSLPPTVNTFTVIPTIVRAGQEAQITWDVSNTSACLIESSDNNNVSGGATGSGTTVPLEYNRTTFTLFCQDASLAWVELASQTVQLLPVIYE